MTAVQTDLQPGSDFGTSQGIDVKCAGLTKIFKDFWLRNRVTAVHELDLEIERGTVFGLLGPNGSGKSTTIKMILGLLTPTAGRIAVLGKRPEDVMIKKAIGYLPEESYLYRFLSATETLDYYGRLFHQSRAQRRKRIDMLLEMVGLQSMRRRPVGEYSKGMQRRIGLAQALINDPQLLLLDEPTTGLDPIGTQQIKDLILELRRRGKTVLLCSHLLGDVEDVCDRVAIMFGGKIRAEGTCDELLVQQNYTTIRTPSLDDETIQQIESVLAARGMAIDQVARPRQRLESLFLDIVHQAEADGAVSHGARGDGQIAGFLTGEEQAATDGERVIEELVAPSAQPARPAPAAAPQAEEQAAEDQQVLADLVGGGQPEPAADEETPQEAKKHDQSVIDGLLEDSSDGSNH